MSGATGLNLLVSTFTVALGAFVLASPSQASRIWGSEKLDRLAPAQRVLLLRWYRIFGALLCLEGLLFAVDSIGFSNYHR